MTNRVPNSEQYMLLYSCWHCGKHRLFIKGREPLDASIGCLECRKRGYGTLHNIYTTNLRREDYMLSVLEGRKLSLKDYTPVMCLRGPNTYIVAYRKIWTNRGDEEKYQISYEHEHLLRIKAQDRSSHRTGD